MNLFQYLKTAVLDEFLALKELVKEHVILTLLFLGLVAAALVYLKPFAPSEIRLAAGVKDGAYYDMANAASDFFDERGVGLVIKTTKGSIENARRIADPKDDVEAGFVQAGALTAEQASLLYSLGSVAYEPVWVFYHANAARKITNLDDINGLRVGIGPEQGGTRAMTRELMGLYDIQIDQNPLYVISDYADLMNQFLTGKLDVLIKVAPFFDSDVQTLLRKPEIMLFDFERAPAYQKLLPYVYTLTLPAFSVSLKDKLPAKDITLIATTTTLAVDKDLHPDLQMLLLMAIRDVQRSTSYLFFSARGEFPAYMDSTIQISPTALRYYDHGVPVGMRYLPFWLAGFVDRMWVLILTILAFIFPLSRLNIKLRFIRYGIKNRRHYEKLLHIEENFYKGAYNAHNKQELLHQLNQLNHQAIHDRIPMGMESKYFTLIGDIEKLRIKTNRIQES